MSAHLIKLHAVAIWSSQHESCSTWTSSMHAASGFCTPGSALLCGKKGMHHAITGPYRPHIQTP